MSNDHSIAGLRARLFAAIDGVRDGSLDVERAEVIGELAQVVVNTARVEVDYVRANGGGESEFIEAVGQQQKLPQGITAITRHRLAG